MSITSVGPVKLKFPKSRKPPVILTQDKGDSETLR